MSKVWFKIYLIALTLFLFLMAHNLRAGVVGTPEGKPRIEIGDKAPLITPELIKANKEGKVILLMFGNTWHCQYCEKMWSNIEALMPQYKKDVASILKATQRVKLWQPDEEGINLAKAYGIIGEPWLFIIDRKGIVKHIFMGFAGKDKIEEELKKVLVKN